MRMSEVHADTEQARQFVAPSPLEQYRSEVGEHLQYIEHGASMICRRVAMLDRLPGFDTRAQDEVNRAEVTLERALDKIRAAKIAMGHKPQERTHAA
jgi:hypothetical protein